MKHTSTLCRATGLLLGTMAAATPLAAQNTSLVQQFYYSTVVLNTGDTLRGPLRLYLDRDVLAVTMPDSTVRTVAAVAVRTFAVRGAIIPYQSFYPFQRAAIPARARRLRQGPLRARQFLVYWWDHDKGSSSFTSPAFFERLNGGPVILLRRRTLVQRTLNQTEPHVPSANLPTLYRPSRSGMFITYTDVLDRFYLATPQGQIVTLKRPRRDLLAYFEAEAAQLEAYAEQNRLRYEVDADLARLVDYGNALRYAVARQ